MGIGIVIVVVALLSLLAVVIRKALVWIAKRNGYTADEMPLHYHMFAMGTYFTLVFLLYVVADLTTKSI